MSPSLERLFDPLSVAVVGASDDPNKWGYQYSAKLLAAEDRRSVHLVNRKRSPVLGRATHASIADVPETPDVAVLCVPRDAILAEVEAAVARGVRFLVCISAGFAETGAEGRDLQERVLAAVRTGGARLVGPNCLGVVDTHARFHCNAFWDVPTGRVALLSQSGGILLEIGERLARSGLGLSRGVSVGNQADILFHEYFDAVIDDPNSDALVVYAEAFRSGRAFLDGAVRVISHGKPVIVLAAPSSEAVDRAMTSHTGSMVSGDAVVDAALSAAGIIRTTSTRELITALKGVLAKPRMRGRRVAVVADGGGAAVLGAGAASAIGLDLPCLSDDLIERLRPLVGPGSGLTNPIDFVGALDLAAFQPVCEAIAASGEVDGIILTGLLNNVRPDADMPEEPAVGRRFAESIAATGTALAAATPLSAEPATVAMDRAGVPVFDGIDQAAHCFVLAAGHPPRLAPLPPPTRRIEASPDYLGARALVAAAGVAFPAAERAESLGEALAAADRIGYPVVLKALGLDHKSDLGGVRLDLATADALSDAVRTMARDLDPPAFSVEAMVPGREGVEILIGAVRDPAFGPMIAVGLGGVLTEVLADTALAPAPADEEGAAALLGRLRGRRLLDGFRGRPAVDRAALARTVAAFSRFVAAHPEIVEAELNPVLALPDRTIALDARIKVD
jgi:acyl-CoA synthetase (NDP forming)